MTGEAQFEEVGCIIRLGEKTGQQSLHIAERTQDINHWVACIKAPQSHGDGAPAISDSSTDETLTFAAIYLSKLRFVIVTIADGSCGLDVMCLMLGLQRERQVRQSLRWELAAFVLRHTGNRA